MLIPESRDYTKAILLNALLLSTTFELAQVTLSQLDPEVAEIHRTAIMTRWEDAMLVDWNRQLAAYNEVAASETLTNADRLPATEDMQQEWNELMREVRGLAVNALWPEGRPRKGVVT